MLLCLAGEIDMLTRLWPEKHFDRYRSAAVALSAVRVDHTYRVA